MKTFLFGLEKKWEDRKYNLYKLTHMPLLKKNYLLKKNNKVKIKKINLKTQPT